MTDKEFDAIMSRGLKEANSAELYDVDEVIDELIRGLSTEEETKQLDLKR